MQGEDSLVEHVCVIKMQMTVRIGNFEELGKQKLECYLCELKETTQRMRSKILVAKLQLKIASTSYQNESSN